MNRATRTGGPIVAAAWLAVVAAPARAEEAQPPPEAESEELTPEDLEPPSRSVEPEPQPHQVDVNFELRLSTEYRTQSITGAQYTWTPVAPLERRDEVAPILRRFVRHPSSAWVRAERESSRALQTVTGAHVGGTFEVPGDRLFVAGRVGIEQVQVNYDDNEGLSGEIDYGTFESKYYTLPFTVEAGGRPAPLLAVSALYRLRPIIAATPNDQRVNQIERSGSEQEIGGRVTVATRTDRLLASLAATWATTDWTFTGFHPGDITASGLRAEATVALQTSPTLSLFLRAAGRSESWDNARGGENESAFVGSDTSRRSWLAEGDVGIIFWYRGTAGFKVCLTGGYEHVPPIYYHALRLEKDRPFGGLSLGVQSRW